MKYDSGLQSVHRSGAITLKPFEEGYALTNKNTTPNVHFQKFVITNHWMENVDFLLRAVLTENVHRLQKHDFCMLCFHVCTLVCFHLISNVQIVKTFENRIPIQTFEKWHNVSYRYVSYIKSETFDIRRTGA